MKKIIRKIKLRLGFYKPEYAYNVKTSDIVIPTEFIRTKQRFKKMTFKCEYFRKHSKYESKVFLTKDFVLIDGYTTYLLCIENGDRYIEAYFID